MASTSFAVNDALAVKLWSKMLDSEPLKAIDIVPLIGDDKNSIIQRKTETEKGPGDQVTFALKMQLSQAGFTRGETAEGNGEEITRYSDALLISELGGNVGVESENTIDAQRVSFDLRMEAKDSLAEWWAKRLSVSFFNQVCGYTAETNTKFTGLQAAIAPSSTRIIRQASAATDQALTSNDRFSLDLVDKAKEMAETATPKIRPVVINGAKKYVMYLHPYQITDMRISTSTGQWLDIQKAAMAGMDSSKSPIYTGALGEYNDVILRRADDVTQGVNSSSGAAISTVRRAVLLGAQAAVCAYGQKNRPGKYRWNEELLDHGRKLEVSAWAIWGLKKTVFNSTDFGTVVVSTYAAAHT